MTFLASLSAFSQTVSTEAGKSAARVDLKVSTIEGSSRTRATFTATVAPNDSAAASLPTGSVSFMDGDRLIGAAFVDEEGHATYTASALPAGEQKITAVYQGDDGYVASSSTPAFVNSATSGVPGFTLSPSVAALKAVAGTTAVTVITATPENGFNQAVSLSCSGVPIVSVTCVFSPISVTPGARTAAAPNGTPAISTLSIQTTAASGAMLYETLPKRGNETAYAIAIPGILALAGLGLARKRAFASARLMGLLLLLCAGSIGLGGCSQLYRYNHRPPAGNPGTPVGTYTVTISGITGTGSSLFTGTTQVTLTVTAK